MTAPNHALTGALIGLSIENPGVAAALAFISHFICDAIPHYDPYDPKKQSSSMIIGSQKFFREQIVGGFILCVLIVALLAALRPRHWFLAAVCAFLAASPDLISIPRFISVKRTGKDIMDDNIFWRFHHHIQWKTGPRLIWLEAIWFLAVGALVVVKL